MCFSMYTRPIGDILIKRDVQYHIYADDIQLFLSCDPNIPGEVECVLYRLRMCVKDIELWMTHNKLKLNRDKTEFLIASSRHQYRLFENANLILDNGIEISPSTSVRNLGVIFDRFMNMNDHISSLSKSVNFHIRNLSQIRKYIDKDTCHKAVRSLITSRLDYCNSLLNNTTSQNLNRLQILQNKAARLIHRMPKFTTTSPLIQDLHWLRIPQRIQFKTITLAYKSLNNQTPHYITELLHVRESRYNFRSSCRIILEVPRINMRAGDQSFSVAAPKLWNALPNKIASADSIASLKKQLKTHLFV